MSVLIVQEMEAEGQQRQAEHHYCAAGDWKGAVNMYRAADMWEESYRVSKFNTRRSAHTNLLT